MNGLTTTYYRSGGQLVGQYRSDGKDVGYFLDGNGGVYGIYYDDVTKPGGARTYYFVYNAQGDVIGLYNFNGTLVATYSYDEWGKCTVNALIPDDAGNPTTSGNHVAYFNQFRYRGYMFDDETGFYYLGSRYYDPTTGRFINADGMVSTGQGILGNNMFAYCGNNPISRCDPIGNCWLVVGATCILDIPCGNPDGFSGELFECDVSASKLKEMGFKDTSPESVNALNMVLYNNGMDTDEQRAHFLSQCAFESGYGKWLTEIGSESYFSKKAYGYKYRGAGYIQLTWDYNYLSFSKAMGDPNIYALGADYVAQNYAWESAGWWWSNNKMTSRIANGASVKDVTKRVKGSSASWQKRQEYYDRILNILR